MTASVKQVAEGAEALMEAFPTLMYDFTPAWFRKAAEIVLRTVLPAESDEPWSLPVARMEGRRAAAILERPPAEADVGYTDEEVAEQYAAADRLIAAFRRLDAEL